MMLTDKQCEQLWSAATKECPIVVDSDEGRQVMAWVAAQNKRQPMRRAPAGGNDPTVGGYIQQHGGIRSNVDGKTYTSERAYKEHLKANDCHIADYKQECKKSDYSGGDIHIDFSK
jgi:hypothetical protein